MKPEMFCRNTSGVRRWQAQLDEVRRLLRALGKQHAVVGEDRHREAPDAGEAGDQGRAVERLEFVQVGAVDDARDHVAHVVGRAPIGRHDPVQFGRVVARRHRLGDVDIDMLDCVEAGDDVAHDLQRVLVGLRHMVDDAGAAAHGCRPRRVRWR